MSYANAKPSLLLGFFSSYPQITLLAIVILAFALRLARLTFQPLWWDEGYSLFFATRDLSTMLDRTALDIHPPLYYALLQFWTFFAGTNDFSTRFFSVALGVLAIPFIYALARRLLPRRLGESRASSQNEFSFQTSKTQALRRHARGEGALIAAFLFAIAPIEVYYSQEVRMYGLVTFLCLASTYFVARVITAPTRLTWVAYVLASVAALYTQYYAAFVLIFHAIFILTKSRFSFFALRFWIGAWASTALLYLPWVVYAGSRLINYVTFKVGHEAYPTQDPISFLAQHLAAFSVGHASIFSWLDWASILFITLAGVGIARRFSSVLLLYLLIPLALGYLINLRFPFHPIRYERLLLLASPAFFLLVARGIAAIKPRALAFSALTALCAFSALSLYDFYAIPRYPNDDYRPLIAQMQTLAQPNDNFLAIYPWQIGYLASYYQGAPLNIIETPNDAWTNKPAQMRNDLNALLAKNPRLWLPALQTLGRIVEDSLDAELRPNNYSVLDTWFGTTRLELFQHAADPPKSTRVPRFGSELANWGVSANWVVSGQDIVRVWFDWGDIAQKKLSIRLVDAKGNIWAQDDRDIERGMQRVGFAIPAGTPPGAYDLRIALYRTNESTSEAVSIASVNVSSNEQPNLAAMPQRVKVDFGNGLSLVGFESSDKPLKPGTDSDITFFWQAAQKQNADYVAAIQLQDAFGKTWLNASDAIARGIYGSSQWGGNELIRDPHTFTVSGDMPDGNYSLAVALIDPVTRARVGNVMRVTQVQVKGRPHYFGARSPMQKSNARVGEIAKLVGYDLVRSGKYLQVVLYWQALGRGQIAYKVFVHEVDASGKIIAQRDGAPGAGEFPTTTWVKGEYLLDVYDIALPDDLGDFQIRVGMYDPSSGVRLPVFDAAGNQAGDFVLLK